MATDAVFGAHVVIGTRARNRVTKRVGAQVVRGVQILAGAQVVFAADAVGGAQVVDATECPARASPLHISSVPIADRMALHRMNCRFMVTPPKKAIGHLEKAEMHAPGGRRHSCHVIGKR
jgi:hypothetical protein